jgi:hypothetical protein
MFVTTKSYGYVNVAHIVRVKKSYTSDHADVVMSDGDVVEVHDNCLDVALAQTIPATPGYEVLALIHDIHSRKRIVGIGRHPIIAWLLITDGEPEPVAVGMSPYRWHSAEDLAIKSPNGQVVSPNGTYPNETLWLKDQRGELKAKLNDAKEDHAAVGGRVMSSRLPGKKPTRRD